MSLSFINPLFHVFPGKLWILMWLSPVAQAVFSAKRPRSSAVPTYLRLSQLALLAVDVPSWRELSVRVMEPSLKYPATPPLQ